MSKSSFRMLDYGVEIQALGEKEAKRLTSATDGPSALQQHGCYGLALRDLGAQLEVMTVSYREEPVFSALVLRQHLWGFVRARVAFRVSLPESSTSDILRAIKKQSSPWRWRFLAIMPETVAGPDAHAPFRQAGFTRVMTGASTIWVDLRPAPDELRAQLQSKWRNQLTKAEREPLTITVGGKKPKHYNWLLEKEAQQRLRKVYHALPLGLVPVYADAAAKFGQDEAGILSVSAYSRGQPVAGAIFLRHGHSATYHIGWSGDDGRRFNAQNRVLFEGLLALKAAGIDWLDLGGVETKTQAGITRFKMGLGYPVATLPGLYLAT